MFKVIIEGGVCQDVIDIQSGQSLIVGKDYFLEDRDNIEAEKEDLLTRTIEKVDMPQI